jgi:hypothetical protein
MPGSKIFNRGFNRLPQSRSEASHNTITACFAASPYSDGRTRTRVTEAVGSSALSTWTAYFGKMSLTPKLIVLWAMSHLDATKELLEILTSIGKEWGRAALLLLHALLKKKTGWSDYLNSGVLTENDFSGLSHAAFISAPRHCPFLRSEDQSAYR